MNTITALRIAFVSFVQSSYTYLLSSHWVLKLLGDPDKGKLGSALWGSSHGGELSQDLEVAMAHTVGRAETAVTGWALRRGGRQTAANWRALSLEVMDWAKAWNRDTAWLVLGGHTHTLWLKKDWPGWGSWGHWSARLHSM